MDKKLFPIRIESDRIVLKTHDASIAETMFRSVDKDRDRLRVFLPWVDHTKTVDDSLGYINGTQRSRLEGTTVDYGLHDARTGTYMGNAGAHEIRWDHGCIELGYWILSDFEGQGFVTEAVRLLERTCFDLGFHRVEIRCSSRNARSAAVPRRLDYALDGVLRENAVMHGQYVDTLVFGKLAPVCRDR